MLLKNNTRRYGAIAQFFHWAMALAIIATLALGLWMVTLDYYDPWYYRAPLIHRSVGVILFAALIARFIWQLTNPRPGSHEKSLAHTAAHWLHLSFYVLLLSIMTTGYLISTASGKAVEVFNWFSIPSVYQAKGMEDWAGELHYFLAMSTLVLVGLHALAALKHHFIDKDDTLRRMLPLTKNVDIDRETG